MFDSNTLVALQGQSLSGSSKSILQWPCSGKPPVAQRSQFHRGAHGGHPVLALHRQPLSGPPTKIPCRLPQRGTSVGPVSPFLWPLDGNPLVAPRGQFFSDPAKESSQWPGEGNPTRGMRWRSHSGPTGPTPQRPTYKNPLWASP